MGISVVRSLGPGVSHNRAFDGRCRFRAAPARTDVEVLLPASDRTDACLRVELRRRQPAGACPGRDLLASDAAGARPRTRSGVPDTRLYLALAEFYVVDKPQGPVRQEPFRGWLPGPRQHWRLRSQRAAADGGLSRTGRRDCMDGAVLSEHARNRRGTGEARSSL